MDGAFGALFTLLIAVAVAVAEPAKAEPMTLTPDQMDNVTAGAASVDVVSLAGSKGQSGAADTSTFVRLVNTRWVQVGFGVGTAQALACCGDGADVGVGAKGIGAGDHVFSTEHVVVHHGNGFAHGVAVATVFVVSWVSLEEIQQDVMGMLSQQPASK